MNEYHLVIIGGGAAGYFAAAQFNHHQKIILLEATSRSLSKVRISGGGRCNLTHNQFDIKKLVENYPRGRKELLGAFSRFQPKDTVEWYESKGVALKTEGDGRMFPRSNKSDTIIECLKTAVHKAGVEVKLKFKVVSIHKVDNLFSIELSDGQKILSKNVLLATGGSLQGFRLAESLGHKIIKPMPSLFTFKINNKRLDDLSGLAFPKVSIRLLGVGKKNKYSYEGPLLITHWGVSGPAILKMSAFAARELHDRNYQATLEVNFLNKTYEDVFEFLKLIRKNEARKSPFNCKDFDVPKRYWQRLLSITINDTNIVWADINNKILSYLAHELTQAQFEINGKGQFKDEFVTSGGVTLKEIDLKTMQSKVCPGLYFSGEILNIDGVTGGFNFQNAWTTAWIAAQGLLHK